MNYSVLDKESNVEQYVAYMLDRTRQMFEYENLPNTIPDYMLELYLQTFGFAAFVDITDIRSLSTPRHIQELPGIYALFGAIGGERDMYYRPRMFIPANPRIPKTIQATILYSPEEVESMPAPHAIIMKNDTQMMGLLPLFYRYANQLTENDISIRSAQINARAQVGIAVSTDSDKESAYKYLDNLEAGKLGIIGKAAFLEGISVSNISTQSSNTIIQLIELQQYLKASWFNEMGLNVNFNMKREYMSEEEIAVNTDILLPLVDDMYQCRVEAIEIINKAFGLNIKVSKSSAWANKEQEDLAALSEASISGNIPLSDAIAEKVNNDEEQPISVATEIKNSQDSIQSEIQTDAPEEQDVQSTDGANGANEAENGDNNEGNQVNRQDEVNVTVNVNINSEGGNIDVDETQEKSEKSDSE